MTIVRLADFPDFKPQIVQIFFETAKQQSFVSEYHRKEFRETWLDPYLNHFCEDVFLFIKDGDVAGYLTGVKQSCVGLPDFKTIGYYEELLEEYLIYPAHFHINVSLSFQRQGIGQSLVKYFINECHQSGVSGVNIVTGCDSKNRCFYCSCGFKEIKTFNSNNKSLLMLGRET